MKICTGCKVEKELDQFHKKNANKDKLDTRCKLCKIDSNRKWLSENKDREGFKERRKESAKKCIENNKERYIIYERDRRRRYKDLPHYNSEEYKVRRRRSHKIYYEKNKERKNKYCREYNKINREKLNKMQLYKIHNDPIFGLKWKMRMIVRRAIIRSGYTKKSRTHEIIGCSFEELRLYIESKFEPWMNWENRGLYNGELNHGWDIDHIIPLSSAVTEDEVLKLNHYTNLQPLCGYTNRHIKRNNNQVDNR